MRTAWKRCCYDDADVFTTVAVALLLLVAIGASVQMVHLAGLAPLLVTCVVLVVVIGQSVRARS